MRVGLDGLQRVKQADLALTARVAKADRVNRFLVVDKRADPRVAGVVFSVFRGQLAIQPAAASLAVATGPATGPVGWQLQERPVLGPFERWLQVVAGCRSFSPKVVLDRLGGARGLARPQILPFVAVVVFVKLRVVVWVNQHDRAARLGPKDPVADAPVVIAFFFGHKHTLARQPVPQHLVLGLRQVHKVPATPALVQLPQLLNQRRKCGPDAPRAVSPGDSRVKGQMQVRRGILGELLRRRDFGPLHLLHTNAPAEGSTAVLDDSEISNSKICDWATLGHLARLVCAAGAPDMEEDDPIKRMFAALAQIKAKYPAAQKGSGKIRKRDRPAEPAVRNTRQKKKKRGRKKKSKKTPRKDPQLKWPDYAAMNPSLRAFFMFRASFVETPKGRIALRRGIRKTVVVFGPSALEQAVTVLLDPVTVFRWGNQGATGCLRRCSGVQQVATHFDDCYAGQLASSPLLIVDALQLAAPCCFDTPDVLVVPERVLAAQRHEAAQFPPWVKDAPSAPLPQYDTRRQREILVINYPLSWKETSSETKARFSKHTQAGSSEMAITFLREVDLEDKPFTNNLHVSAVERALGQQNVRPLFYTFYCQCSNPRCRHPMGHCFADAADRGRGIERFPGCGHQVCAQCLEQCQQQEHYACPCNECGSTYSPKTAPTVPLYVSSCRFVSGKKAPRSKRKRASRSRSSKSTPTGKRAKKKAAAPKPATGALTKQERDILQRPPNQGLLLDGLFDETGQRSVSPLVFRKALQSSGATLVPGPKAGTFEMGFVLTDAEMRAVDELLQGFGEDEPFYTQSSAGAVH